jgi:hypothetical protein
MTGLRATKLKIKIYIFLQAQTKQIAQWVALSEHGFCLASLNLPVNASPMAEELLGVKSSYAKSYEKWCPEGYELVFIKDINAPENYFLLERLQKEASARVKEYQEKGAYRPAGQARDGVDYRGN